jgi:hypothetical protein
MVNEGFLEIFPLLHDCVMELQTDSRIGNMCECGSGLKKNIKCADCIQPPLRCNQCYIKEHQYTWTHRVKVWEDGHFVVRTATSLGFQPQLGHDGDACPVATQPVELILGDGYGIHDTRVRYCGCANGPTRVAQLMRAELFPGTTTQPRMAFTFCGMRKWSLEILECAANVYDIAAMLRRLTDNTYPWRVSVSSSHFVFSPSTYYFFLGCHEAATTSITSVANAEA